jgi:hypothetical protein
MELSFLLHALHRHFIYKVVRVKWLIPSHNLIEINEPSTGNLVHTSFSRAEINSKSLTTFRFLNRHHPSSQIAITAWTTLGGKENASGVILAAEDARAFSFNSANYIYFQRPSIGPKGLPDCTIHIYDPSSKNEWEVRVEGISYNGKNWIPFERNGKLHFIYSISPLIVVECSWGHSNLIQGRVVFTEDQDISTDLHWGDELAYFGAARGGSQLVPLTHDVYIGFTHITSPGALKFSHQAGVLLFNPKNMKVLHRPISKLIPGLLVDPFGINIQGSTLDMHYSYAVNNPSDKDVIVGSSTVSFELKDLFRALGISDLQIMM